MEHLLDYPGFMNLFETSQTRMYGSDQFNNILSEDTRIGSLGRRIDGWNHERNLICVEGNYLIPMSSCDYLGLSHHPEVKEAAISAIKKYGTGSTGVRTLTGNIDLYYKLEDDISKLKNVKSAFIGTSGYAINSYIIPHLFNEKYFIAHDFYTHASMRHGISASRSSHKCFKHNDLSNLSSILNKIDLDKTSIIMVDGVYSMQGTIAPLKELIELKKKYGCKIWVDEAHAIGVLGEKGQGLHSYFNVDSNEVDFWVGTLSKSIPGIGGYIASSEVNLYELLMGSVPYNIFSSAIQPSSLATAIKAINIMLSTGIHARLKANIAYFKNLMKEAGFKTISHPDSSIYLLEIGSILLARNFTDKLREQGVFCHEIIYPALPKKKSAIRLTVTATHTKQQLSECVEVLLTTFKYFKYSNEIDKDSEG